MRRGDSVPFTHPDTQAIIGHLEAAADSLADQGGTLAWGVFRRGETGTVAQGDVPYRIASMTKSFTAALMGHLTSKGLDLDRPLGQLIPDIADTSIADRTCRQALTMGTGFTKDDPWADRVESMTKTELVDYLKAGAIPIGPADTGYEYSNLGYALLGLVAEAVTGRPFIDLVTTEVLEPVGLTRTGFDIADFPDLMPGIRIDRNGGGHPAELTGPGAFSPIGGVISTVNDIGAWMDAHMDALENIDAYAPEALPRILNDNQQAHRLIEVQHSEHHTESVNYGFGLQPRLDSRFGRVACHSGGYPGYGSHMRWFPDLGLSIVVFGNTTYYPAESTVRDAIDAGWAAATGNPGLQLTRRATAVPSPHHAAAPEQAETVLRAANLVIDFDDTVAEELFTVNMDLDEPRAERGERFAAWREEQQLTRAFSAENVTMTTPLKGTVTVPGGQAGGETNPAQTSPTITVSLDHLGEVQTISLSS
ncbi:MULTISPECIES: serine hydrolase domain-containing protein [unclassified Brevibacterium]|uniref:serine hydrolase domain-containing protein n=1 Tax=unclassified Brevibacterium TaxID=2614124 RepID=UPI000C549E1C|nr:MULTISPECIES: serine hydrolase domain-containing protein [unclassified Brevibacterium]SMX80520.1 CubicO group peptidase, beta-lactamase class C family [Brevibacterium sp. 239c]